MLYDMGATRIIRVARDKKRAHMYIRVVGDRSSTYFMLAKDRSRICIKVLREQKHYTPISVWPETGAAQMGCKI